MANVKITALPASAGLSLADIFPVVDDPGGAAATQKSTFTQLVALLDSINGTGPYLPLAGGTMTGLLQFSGTGHFGLRLNNLTTAQRDAVGVGSAGNAIWNTTTARFDVNIGGSWKNFVRLDGDNMTGSFTITGPGATSATTPFLVEDSGGADMFAIRGDGSIGFGKQAIARSSNVLFSVFNPAADFSGVVVITPSVGISAPLSLFGGEVRIAGAQSVTNFVGLRIMAGTSNSAVDNSVIGVSGRAKSTALAGRAEILIGGSFGGDTGDASAGTFTTVAALRATIGVEGAATATNSYGLLVADIPTNAGTMTNTYGVYVGDVTLGTQTAQAYSFYASDANARNFFAGNTMFGALVQMLGATSAFPALKRSATILQTRLADDSAYAPFEASTVRLATAFTVATLPAAGTAGRMAYVTDALTPTFLTLAVGGGAVISPVFDNGTNWVTV